MDQHAAPPPPPVSLPRDWRSVASLTLAVLALLSCQPWMSMLAGLLAWAVRRRRLQRGLPARMALAALWVSASALVLQLAVGYLSSEWIAPTMQRRTLAAITDVIEGRAPQATTPAVPVQRSAEPDAGAVQEFARKLRETMGALQSVSKVHEDIGGSPLAPTVSLALVLQFEKGSVTGSATLQWLPASEEEARISWLPSAHVLELDISLPDGSSAVLRAAETGASTALPGSDPAQTPATAPSTPSNP